MKVIEHIEDPPTPADDYKRTYFIIELDNSHFVDIMIAEESNVIYSMENQNGSTVYGVNENETFKDFKYDEKEAFGLAAEAFEKLYGRRPEFIF